MMKPRKNGIIWLKLSSTRLLSFKHFGKCCDGKTFANNEEVKSAVDDFFEELGGFNYKHGVEAIHCHWEKSIELKCIWRNGLFLFFIQI